MFGEIERDRPPTLKAASAIGVEAGECLLEEILLIRRAFAISDLSWREIGNWLASVSDSIPPLTAIFPQVREPPLHHLVGRDIGEIAIDRSGDL